MQSVVLNDLADDVIDNIIVMASRNHISFEEQVSLLLTEVTRREQRPDRTAVLEAIAAMTPQGVPQTDSVELLREERDR